MTIVDSAIPGSVECSMRVGDSWIGVDVGLLQYEAGCDRPALVRGFIGALFWASGSVQDHHAITAHVGFGDKFDLHVSYAIAGSDGTKQLRVDDIVGCRLMSVHSEGRAEFKADRIKCNGYWCF